MEPQTIESIIKTFCYHEVFSYPLTFSELSKYVISKKKITDRELLFTLSKYQSFFEESQGFIVLKNSKKNIKNRLALISESRRKLAKAIWVSQILSHIPTIQLIGISGSLAMYNAKKHDDIDLFFVTSKNTLWVTRFFVVMILFFLGQKRGVKEKVVMDKICPNMFLSEDALSIQKHARNLYTAHEVAQLKVIYEKNDMKQRFFYENSWVLRFLPHAFIKPKNVQKEFKSSRLLGLFDDAFFLLQKLYMKRKITIEVVQKNRAFFHPIKAGNVIMKIYRLKVLHRKRLLTKTEVFSEPLYRVN